MNQKVLVGVTHEYRSKGKVVTDSLSGTREEIRKGLAEAVKSGAVGIPLLAEMYGYYSLQPYFVAVRGTFVFGRLREGVHEWLKENSEHRVSSLIGALKKKDSKHRGTYVKAVKFLLRVHPRYTKDFKECLSAEEYEYIR